MAEGEKAKKPCRVAEIRASLSEDEALDFDKAMSEDGPPLTWIVSALTKRGFEVGTESIRRHRRGECRACAER